MSQSISIICSPGITFLSLKAVIEGLSDGPVVVEYDEKKNELQAAMGNEWYIDISEVTELRDLAIEEYLDMADSEEFKFNIYNYIIYNIRYNVYPIMKSIMEVILQANKEFLSDIWIDNDYGVIISGKSFLKHLEGDNNWDWRSQSI